MIKFVIVEDEAKHLKNIRKVVDKFKYEMDNDIKILEFKGYTKELETFIKTNDERAIYILDIQLDNSLSGIEIASIIRENDWESEIIFITNHDKMFETVHRNIYEVFDFIEKYHGLNERLSNDIKVILSKNVDKKYFSYKGRNIDIQVYFNSIKYIYRDKEDRKLVIVTDASSYSVSLSIKDILEELDDRFKLVHRSCIVNTDKVSIYNWNKSVIILKDGTVVNYLSKKYRKELEK